MLKHLKLVCLHGFLGQTSDFNFLGPALAAYGIRVDLEVGRKGCRASAEKRSERHEASEEQRNVRLYMSSDERRFVARSSVSARLELEAIDLWPYAQLPMSDCVEELGKRLDGPALLLGYSMGGRLALQTFLRYPDRAVGLVVVSSHPGGLCAQEARARLVCDHAWATRFERDGWADLDRDWNAQSVFCGRAPSLARSESCFDRTRLAGALRNWSVAHQPGCHEALAREDRPVLWLAGELDTKYCAIAREMGQVGRNLRVRIVDDCGHRVSWEAPDAFVEELASFLREYNGSQIANSVDASWASIRM